MDWVSDEELTLTEVEQRLVCGEAPAHGGSSHRAWEEIPASQARFVLRSLLQDRGYYAPQFTFQDPTRGDPLVVYSGKKTRVHAWKLDWTQKRPPSDFTSTMYQIKRGVVGEVLTPALLTDLEQWVLSRLRSRGYGCARARARAEATTGEITVSVELGERYLFKDIEEETLSGVEEGRMRRYDAFELGEWLNRDQLTLTERRIQADGVLQSAHFTLQCEPSLSDVSEVPALKVRQESVPGPPRLVSFGFGSNTEGLLLARATWSHRRLGASASAVSLNAQASFRDQSASVSGAWYFLPQKNRKKGARLHWRPELFFQRRNEIYFSEAGAITRLGVASGRDSKSLGWKFHLGPLLETYTTLSGVGPRRASFASLEAELQWMSHDFEYDQSSPRAGFWVRGRGVFASRQLLSDQSVQRFVLEGQRLWNWRHYDPAAWVLALRGSVAVTWVERASEFAFRLPPSFRQFLGGGRTLRGFGRLELPGTPAGSLTSFYLGLESRWRDVLPARVEPFVFFDLGALGRESARLDPTWFASPGVGLRWESQFGTLRATLAHGATLGNSQPSNRTDDLSHFQFYLSFGEEF